MLPLSPESASYFAARDTLCSSGPFTLKVLPPASAALFQRIENAVVEDLASIASMTAFLMRCLLRLPSCKVSASNAPLRIHTLTVEAFTRGCCATSRSVKYSASMSE